MEDWRLSGRRDESWPCSPALNDVRHVSSPHFLKFDTIPAARIRLGFIENTSVWKILQGKNGEIKKAKFVD